MTNSSISTHVLDATIGQPAAGVHVELTSDNGAVIAVATTNDDGRVADFNVSLAAGSYRLTFATSDYFRVQQRATLYPMVTIDFMVDGDRPHYHIPLLLSPYSYSTYQGS